jgi:hypothetical protein
MENLVTLKFEGCKTDLRTVTSVLDRSGVVNLSLRGTQATTFPVPNVLPLPPAPSNSRHTLKVVDFSETRSDFTRHLFQELVVDNENCAITHLYVEKCDYIPFFNSPAHLGTVQFISVAGSYDYGAFTSIKAWKSLKPAMKFINASGCGIGDNARKDLIVSHRLVHINVNWNFEESPRRFV